MLYVTFYRLLRYLTKRNMNLSLNFVKDMQVLQYVWCNLPLICIPVYALFIYM